MKVKGVLDRIVDGKHATILVEELNEEYVLNIDELPNHASEGDWYDLTVNDGKIEQLIYNESFTRSRRKTVESKLSRLKQRAKSKYRKKQ